MTAMEIDPVVPENLNIPAPIASTANAHCFGNIIYWLDDSIAPDHRQRLGTLLKDGGAKAVEVYETGYEAPHDATNPINSDTAERMDSTNNGIDEHQVDEPSVTAHPAQPRFDIDACTHIITRSWNTIEIRHIENTPRWKNRLGDNLWIVKPEWVSRSVIVGLQSPQHYSPDPKLIFSGIIINCAEGFPPGDIEAIYGAVNTFGGQHRRFATKEITHMICVQPTPTQFKAISETGLGIKIVLPEWIQECIKLRRLVPTEAFEFTSATTLPPIRTASIDEVPGSKIKRAYIDQDDHQRTIIWTSRPNIDEIFEAEQDADAVQKTGVFAGKKVLLGIELDINPRTKEALDQWIIMAGGTPIAGEEGLADCDVYITRWREGPGYWSATKLGKTVGTLLWFYYVLRVGRLASPLDALLHYPVPRNGVPGFSRLKIALTNYTGDSREYLKKLITAMGGSWTNDMARTENTHLVAANIHSDKVERAQHWGINTVNHFWLEDCFVRWEHLGEGHRRYTDFPPGVNYMSLLGQTHLSEDSLVPWTRKALAWGEEEEMGAVEQDIQMGDPTQPAPHATARPRTPTSAATDDDDEHGHGGRDDDVSSKRGDSVVAMMDQDTPKAGPSRQTAAESSRSASPDARKASVKRNAKQTQGIDGHGDVDDDQPMAPVKKRRRTETTAQDPVEISTGRARRRAATKAEDAVHAMAEDMNLYTKEKKRKDIIPPSERKAARVVDEGDASDTAARRRRRRSSRLGTETEAEVEEGEDEEDVKPVGGPSRTKNERARKVVRQVTASDGEDDEDVKPVVDGSDIFVATTGITLEPLQQKFFKKHGVVITADAKKVTHLIADGLKRTSKFLLAMNQAPIVVTSSWVEACVKADALVDEVDHRLQDVENEKRHGFKLAEALQRAKDAKAQGGLMNGHRIILTASLKDSFKVIKDVVTAAGGTVEMHSSKRLNVEPGGKTYLISCEGDEVWWKPYKDRGVPIVEKDYVLHGVWSMRLEPDKYVCKGVPGVSNL